MKIAKYKCQLCDVEVQIVVGANFKPPIRCDTCEKYALKFEGTEEVSE
jgi:hypothetical protein